MRLPSFRLFCAFAFWRGITPCVVCVASVFETGVERTSGRASSGTTRPPAALAACHVRVARASSRRDESRLAERHAQGRGASRSRARGRRRGEIERQRLRAAAQRNAARVVGGVRARATRRGRPREAGGPTRGSDGYVWWTMLPTVERREPRGRAKPTRAVSGRIGFSIAESNCCFSRTRLTPLPPPSSRDRRLVRDGGHARLRAAPIQRRESLRGGGKTRRRRRDLRGGAHPPLISRLAPRTAKHENASDWLADAD